MANSLNEHPSRIDTITTGAGVDSIGTSSELLLAANPDRQFLEITNTHATQVLSLGLGATAVALRGIVLLAGEAWRMPSHSIYTGLINAIGSGAATICAIVEW